MSGAFRVPSTFDRITVEPGKMGGRPCIRGHRITVGLVVSFLAGGATIGEICDDYPDLTPDDVRQALAYAAWLVGEEGRRVDPEPPTRTLPPGWTEVEIVMPREAADAEPVEHWSVRVTCDAGLLGGKPVVRGTRLAVDFIVGLLGQGWAEADVLREYPGLAHGDITACLHYASEAAR